MNQVVAQRLTATSHEFLFQIYLPIAVWLLIVLFFFIFMLRRYTFGNWTKENPNPFFGETFDMPRGTFRGILTLTILFVAVLLEMVTVYTPGFEGEIHEFMIGFQMMIAFYFGAKVMHHVTSADRQKAEINAEAAEYSYGAYMGVSNTKTSPTTGSENEFYQKGAVG